MDLTQKQLIEFIERLLHSPRRSRAIGVELVHCTDEGGASLIEQYPLEQPRATPGAGAEVVRAGAFAVPDTSVGSPAINLAMQILGSAQAHVECFAMPQRYAVLAYLEGEREHCAQKAFLLRPQRNAKSALGSLTEPPTEKGLIAQLMRHTEAAYAANIKLSETIAGMHQSRAEHAETSYNRYIAERERWAGYSAEAEAKAHERRLVELQTTHDQEIQREAMDELKPLLRLLTPAIGRRLAGAIDRRKLPSGSAPEPPKAEGPGAEPPPRAEHPTAEAPPPPRKAAPGPRERLQDLMGSITEAEAEKLAEVLGEDRAQEIVSAVLGVMV